MIEKCLLAIAIQQIAILGALFILDGSAAGDDFFRRDSTGYPAGAVLWCIVIYFVVLILSWNLWSTFRRRPYLKTAMGGCVLGWFAPIIWVIVWTPIWFIFAFMVIPGVTTFYLWLYVAKAERVVPTGL